MTVFPTERVSLSVYRSVIRFSIHSLEVREIKLARFTETQTNIGTREAK